MCAVTLVTLALVAVGPADAQVCDVTDKTVPHDWDLRPSSVGEGERFRLLFVTLGRTEPVSSDIDFYNERVRHAAINGHSAIHFAYRDHFAALASVRGTDARTNTRTTGTGVPVYWLNGPKVADDYADFYDGTWDSATYRTEYGGLAHSLVTHRNVWTGTTASGEEFFSNGRSRALGQRDVAVGRINHVHGLYPHALYARDNPKPLFGLS